MADTVRVTGLKETIRTLEAWGADAAELKDVMTKVGGLVRNEAVNLAPRRTGRLADSIRPGRAKAKAIVRAGSAAVPYAGVINYGWAGHNIDATHFLETALTNEQDAAVRTLAEGLGDLIRKHNLT